MKTNIFAAFLIAFTMWSCNNNKEEAQDHEELPANVVEMNDAQINTAGIELGSIEYKTMKNHVKLNGTVSVSPQNLVSVSAVMGGYIKSISMVQGSPVRMGQVIAVIENPEFIELQQQYLENSSKLEYAAAEFERQKTLNAANANSTKTLQSATADYKALQSSVAALKAKLRLIGIDPSRLTPDNISSSVAIVSPISGYVKTVNVNTGKYVDPSDVVAEIINTRSPMLELSAFENDVFGIAIGQHIGFSVPAHPSESMNAEVYQVGKALGSDKTVKVYATVEGEPAGLIPGMFVNAFVETVSDSVTALPDDAVLTFEDKNYIFIYSEKKKEGDKYVTLYKMIEVTKGISENGYTGVVLPDNFDSKSRIVTKGAYNLLSALRNAGDMAC